jgi:hypothetical protein
MAEVYGVSLIGRMTGFGVRSPRRGAAPGATPSATRSGIRTSKVCALRGTEMQTSRVAGACRKTTRF